MSAPGSKGAAALQLARDDAPVFPLHSALPFQDGKFVCTCGSLGCRNPAKHPVARLAPRGLLDASTDQTRIREWWLSTPNANIGLATGRLIVLDVDPRHGGDESLKQLQERTGPLPLTWRVLTGGGGQHIYFRAPTGVEVRNSAGRLGAGLDVRGVGGYVVAPPSIHISGRTYEWSADHHPDWVPLAGFPSFLLTKLANGGKNTGAAPSEWRDIVSGPIAQGSRNHTLARLAAHLLRRHVDPHVVLELCRIWNMARCCPPLPPDEVVITVNSICGREVARRKAAA